MSWLEAYHERLDYHPEWFLLTHGELYPGGTLLVPSWIAHTLYDHCTLVSPAADPDHSGHPTWSSSRK